MENIKKINYEDNIVPINEFCPTKNLAEESDKEIKEIIKKLIIETDDFMPM